MSMTYGKFQAAVRGPAESIRRLPRLAEEWPRGRERTPGWFQAQSLLNCLSNSLKQIQEAEEGEIEVCSWSDSSDQADLYMELLEYLAGRGLELDMAVGVQTSGSASSGARWSAYYSRAGENTLHPDGFRNCCQVDFEGAAPHLLAVGRQGRRHDVDLAEYEDWYYEDMLSEMPEKIPEFFDEYSHVFWYTPYEDLEEYEDEDLQQGDWGTWYALNIQFKAEDAVQREIENLIPGFGRVFCPVQQGGRGIQPGDYTDQALEQVMKLLFPDRTIHVESREGRPYLWDDDGNEYFPGGAMELVERGFEPIVCWDFPDQEEDPWVPFA